MALFLFFYAPDFAYAENMLEITAGTVNIRSGPSTAYDKVASANKGETYRVIQEKDGWYQIDLNDGEKGWVISTYVKVITCSDLPQYIKINAGIVNIRSGAGTEYNKIGEMTAGTNFSVSGEDGDWYQISLSDGSSGYVAKWLVEVTYAEDTGSDSGMVSVSLPDGLKQGSVNTDTLNLRSSASMSSDKLDTLSGNTKVAIYERSGDWFRIVSETGLQGWVYCQYITLDNTYTSIAAANKNSLPLWSAGGDIYGEIGMDADEDDNCVSIYLSSDDVIVYQIEDGDGKVTVNTDMSIYGDSPDCDGLNVKISGDADNILKITYNNGIYFSKEVSEDGKQLVLRFTYSPLEGKIIYLDPGHGCYGTSGYFDYGATGPSGIKESNVVYAIARKTEAILESWGADVRMTRGEKCYLSLEERAWMANAAHADVFVSIHANAIASSSVNGTSTWFYAPSTDSSYDREKAVAPG